jgi:hypothetical protein
VEAPILCTSNWNVEHEIVVSRRDEYWADSGSPRCTMVQQAKDLQAASSGVTEGEAAEEGQEATEGEAVTRQTNSHLALVLFS